MDGLLYETPQLKKGWFNMKTEQHIYKRTKEDAGYISEIATKLEFLANLEEQDLLHTEKIRSNYEEQRKREIKNALTNIYLLLDLHAVKGVADHIYNPNFNPEE